MSLRTTEGLMAKDGTKLKLPSGTKKAKPGRKIAVRQQTATWRERMTDAVLHPHLGPTLIVWIAFVLVCGFVVGWARELPLIAPGDVARTTTVVRVEFQVVNDEQTELTKNTARQSTPRVLSPVSGAIDALRATLERLPRESVDAAALDDLAQELRESAGINSERLEALRLVASEEGGLAAWDSRLDVLVDVLERNPLLSGADYPRAAQQGTSRQIELIRGDRSTLVPRDQAINAEDAASVRERATRFAKNAGFTGVQAEVVVQSLEAWTRPTYRTDAALQAKREDAAADAVPPVVIPRGVGQTILTRGDVVSPADLEIANAERARFREAAPFWQVWLPRIAVFGAVAALAALAAGLLAVTAPRAASRAPRAAWLAVAMTMGLALSAGVASIDPRFIALVATTSVLQVGVLVVIVYDRRAAMAVGAVASLLVSIALKLPAGDTLVLLTGVAIAAWRLDEIRDRRAIVSMALVSGLVLGGGVLSVRLLSLPMVDESLMQSLRDGLLAAFSGFLVGGTTLFTLPAIERSFDVTTGMTLIELRDPKQPLLRELQQRAPGTYNHSLNVATIAEQAADAIGANGLLTYVGGLYHDVGKMNKPEYFVENQSGGPNKHDKLSPAMSLLVIVGHVKDGVEIAREFGLPKVLHHFIEAHHGTTLVEYFYRRAIERTAENDPDAESERLPEELDYRYPGPKPKTRECAILMLTDAVESATRTLAEPTPSRVDAFVREFAAKRLADGQFDQCDLTFRELQTVVESISKTVASIYHGRISYPGSESKTESAAADKPDKSGGEKTA
ncbi:MAG: HDIG domain-containing metalloprotein [Planctomycetota bacterium]